MDSVTRPTPVDTISTDLFNHLGPFWTRVYSDIDFVKDFCQGSGLTAAQVYIQFLEAVGVLGISSVPVLHRENWTPMLIRKSERDTGKGVELFIGIPEINIGGQEDNSYREGREFDIGGHAVRSSMVSYPVYARDFKDGVNQICSSILNPVRSLVRGVDFFIQDGTVIFYEDNDPFEALDAYPVRVVKNEETGETEHEILLWGSDVLYDKDYIYQHFGYVTGYRQESNEHYKRITQALWDLRVAGNDIPRQNIALGDFLDVASIREPEETIVSITVTEDGTRTVVTDKNVYRVHPNETMLDDVQVGNTLPRGRYLTETIRNYRKLVSDKFYVSNGRTLEDFLNDVPRLYLPKGIVGVPEMSAGFGLGWEAADLIYDGEDANGNAKLRFNIDATIDDEAIYWESVWANAERDGVDMMELLSDYITNDNPLIPGQVVGTINPLKFYMDNCLHANLSVIVVDFDALPEYITSFEPLTRLEGLIPAHTAVILVIRKALEEQDYNLGIEAEEDLSLALGTNLSETIEFDGNPANGLTYINDQLKIRWVRVCN